MILAVPPVGQLQHCSCRSCGAISPTMWHPVHGMHMRSVCGEYDTSKRSMLAHHYMGGCSMDALLAQSVGKHASGMYVLLIQPTDMAEIGARSLVC